MNSNDEQSRGIRNTDGSMTFKKIPPGGAFEMLQQAFEASKANREKPKYEDRELLYLGSFGSNLKSVSIKEGNFCLKLPKSWPGLVAKIETQGLWTQGFFFAGPNECEWAYVMHMILSPDHINDDIEDALGVELTLFGSVMIHPPTGMETVAVKEMTNFGIVPAISSAFLKRHNAAKMASWIGTFRRKETLCRFFTFCIQRGREVWRVEYVFPAMALVFSANEGAHGGNDENAQSDVRQKIFDAPTEPEQCRAGVVLGNFRAYDAAKCQFCGEIVTDDDTVEIPLENVDASKTIGLPIRTDCLLHPYCCHVCKERLATGKIGVSQITAISGISRLLSDGARIKEEWLKDLFKSARRRRTRTFILMIGGLLALTGSIAWFCNGKDAQKGLNSQVAVVSHSSPRDNLILREKMFAEMLKAVRTKDCKRVNELMALDPVVGQKVISLEADRVFHKSVPIIKTPNTPQWKFDVEAAEFLAGFGADLNKMTIGDRPRIDALCHSEAAMKSNIEQIEFLLRHNFFPQTADVKERLLSFLKAIGKEELLKGER